MERESSVPELWERCLNQDEAAWKALVSRYERLVYSTALATGLDRESCGDVFQQVWLELHRSLFRIRDPLALPRWLIVTTRRIAYRQAVVAGRWVQEIRDDLVDPEPGPDSLVALLEQRQQIEEGLAGLDARCREVVKLFFLSEETPSYRDVSHRTGVAEDSVGSLRRRCLDRLRERMEAAS